MLTVQRLYIREFLKVLFLVAAGLSVVVSLLELVNKIDDFPSTAVLLTYAWLILPKNFIYLLPMAVLVCSIFTFGQAFRRREILAVKAAGGRLKRLFLPFVIAGVLVSIAAFSISEFIVPDFTRKATDLRRSMAGKQRHASVNEEGIWLKSSDGSPVRMDLYIVGQNIAKGVHIFVFGGDFLKERLSAENAVWNGSVWVLENITRYDVDTGEITKIKAMEYPGLETPELFAEDINTPDEMGFGELYRYLQRLKKAGYRNSRLLVDMHSKISFPLVNIFMIILGISLAVRGRMGSGLFTAGLGLVLSLVYWLGYTFFLSLGYAGVLPSFIAAWVTPVIFGWLSLALFRTIPE